MVSAISQRETASGTLARLGHCRWVLFTKVPDYTQILEPGCVWCAWRKDLGGWIDRGSKESGEGDIREYKRSVLVTCFIAVTHLT